jgi:NitT/TauT family transport system substrate-binding protein
MPINARLAAYQADERGLFVEEGLSVELHIMPTNSEALLALMGGSLDVTSTSVASHLLMRDQGADLRVVAAGTTERRGNPVHGLLVAAGSPIQTARDLEGKTIAVSTTTYGDRLMVQAWLESHGVDPNSVNFMDLPTGHHLSALAEGRAHAASAEEPFLSLGLSQGARLLAHHYTDMNPATVLSYYVATGAWLSGHGEDALRFARAVHRANALLQADPQARQEAMAQHLGLTIDASRGVSAEVLETRVAPEGLAWWIDTGRRLGLFRTPLSAQDILFDSAR